jgi:ubiquinone/menaquinone biosynthesis C-methylase UbiE
MEPIGDKIVIHFGKLLVDLLEIGLGAEVLDLGVGRGACLFPAIEKVGVKGRVVGIDTSQQVVDSTCSMITERGIVNAEIMQMDVQQLRFAPESFDFMIGGFVLPFILAHEQDRLSPGIFRGLRKGGQIGLSTWERIEDEEWLATYLSRHLSAKKFSGDLENFMKVTDKELKTILLKSGFRNVICMKREAEFVYANPQQWLETMKTDPDYKKYFDQIKAKGPKKFDSFKQDAFTDLRAKEKPRGIPFTISVYFAFCTKQVRST